MIVIAMFVVVIMIAIATGGEREGDSGSGAEAENGASDLGQFHNGIIWELFERRLLGRVSQQNLARHFNRFRSVTKYGNVREQLESPTLCHRNGRFHDDFPAFRKHFPVLLPGSVNSGLVVGFLAMNYWICVRSMGLVERGD